MTLSHGISDNSTARNHHMLDTDWKTHLCAITVTVSARLIVRDRHADTQEAKKEVRRAARVKSWAPARINLSINRVAAASSCVVLEIIHKWLCFYFPSSGPCNLSILLFAKHIHSQLAPKP